jgi:hypothetical protein
MTATRCRVLGRGQGATKPKLQTRVFAVIADDCVPMHLAAWDAVILQYPRQGFLNPHRCLEKRWFPKLTSLNPTMFQGRPSPFAAAR